jgi:uncharacterized protein (TIGR03790 family)
MTQSHYCTLLFSLFSFVLLHTSNAQAEFTPDDVVIIANNTMLESMSLAGYYAKKRGISQENIIGISTSKSESITREDFNKTILFPLKQKFESTPHLPGKKIFVLMHGIPLAIGETQPPPEANIIEVTIRDKNLEYQAKYIKETEGLVFIESEVVEKGSQSLFPSSKQINPAQLLNSIQQLIALVAKSDHPEKRSYLKNISRSLVSLFGHQGQLFLIPPDQTTEKEKIQEKMKEGFSLPTPKDKKNLDLYLLKVAEIFGIVGVLQRVPSLLDELLGSQTGASVDSELTNFWLLPSNIQISNRLPNPLFMHREKMDPPSYPLVLVSRIDGPTPSIVRRNIDATITTEKEQSLSGKFLIDARGIPWDQRDDFGTWDRYLTTLARNTNTGKRFTIEYDGRPELAGETKDIGLYVGWYQVRQYKDVYSFNTGAIGYHIASSEAMSIRNPEEKGWCKNMLERGVVATVGAVNEPYLDSFPIPTDFFNLLLSGKYQLAEVYYLTTRYISWQLVLFGDPLYQPISVETAKKDLGYSERELKKLPTPPSEYLLSAKQMMERRE